MAIPNLQWKKKLKIVRKGYFIYIYIAIFD